MRSDSWFEENRAAIQQRLEFLRFLPDGMVHERPSSMHRLLIRKTGTCLELHFYGGRGKEVLSDLDFANPLHLVAGFTQAMMLGLLWKSEPRRVYVLGFGAGRVPMLLHHSFPDIHVESTDIDQDVVEVAKEYFGIFLDSRLTVVVQDGRDYLVQQGADVAYDIIMLDAFRGVGYSPFPLATTEFFEICKSHLTQDGVVVANLMRGDFLFPDKVKTMAESFDHVHCVLVAQDGSMVFFCSNGRQLSVQELHDRAKILQDVHQFTFPFVEHASMLRNLSQCPELVRSLKTAHILRDTSPPPAFPALEKPYPKVGRNDPCFCGSGKKYKKCHGRGP